MVPSAVVVSAVLPGAVVVPSAVMVIVMVPLWVMVRVSALPSVVVVIVGAIVSAVPPVVVDTVCAVIVTVTVKRWWMKMSCCAAVKRTAAVASWVLAMFAAAAGAPAVGMMMLHGHTVADPFAWPADAPSSSSAVLCALGASVMGNSLSAEVDVAWTWTALGMWWMMVSLWGMPCRGQSGLLYPIWFRACGDRWR